MNQQHNNIKFTKEIESDSTLPFLDVLITKNDDGHLSTSMYRKPTFTGLYLRWDSFVPKEYKNNGYPQNFIQTLVRKFVQLKSSSDVKQTVLGPEKKQIYFNLPFCGSNSSKIGKQLKRIVGKIAPWIKLNLIFKPVNQLKSLSRLKSSYKLLSHSKVVYRINCLDCEEFYVGMTERILQKTY